LGVRDLDDRGNRRPFTIASAPSESEVRLGVKFYRGSSAFKRSLAAMKPGDVIYGSHLAGSFTLPADSKRKLAFIAGGIGITPFRSMVSEMVARGDRRSVVMLYGVNKPDEVAYADLLDRAERELGLRTVYALAKGDIRASNVHRGFIDADLIQREIPDYRERLFYVSGPRMMVLRFQSVLRDLGLSRSRVKIDFFPGFA
jgi:ferredoxin-NADP reductase